MLQNNRYSRVTGARDRRSSYGYGRSWLMTRPPSPVPPIRLAIAGSFGAPFRARDNTHSIAHTRTGQHRSPESARPGATARGSHGEREPGCGARTAVGSSQRPALRSLKNGPVVHCAFVVGYTCTLNTFHFSPRPVPRARGAITNRDPADSVALGLRPRNARAKQWNE